MKRKRASAQGSSRTSEDAAPLSSNWLQLQRVLSNDTKAKGKKTRKVAEPSTVDVKQDGKDEVFSLQPTSSDCSVTKVLALDCEMVGVGVEGKRSALARVSVVNSWGNVLYDKHVRPQEFVSDFRTKFSGVRQRHLKKAEGFQTVQKEVAELIQGRIVVGHALHNDFKALLLSHPRKLTRDTQRYKPLRISPGIQALRHLAAVHLGVTIQEGPHNSVEDARAALWLYKKFGEEWEKTLKPGSTQKNS